MFALPICTLALTISCLLLLDSFTHSLVIYRRKPKPKLICHEELMSSMDGELAMVTPGGSVAEFDLPVPSPRSKPSHHKKHSGEAEQRHRRSAQALAYNVSNANDSDASSSGSVFSVELEEETEPVINLGTSDADNQFEIVGDTLTEEEKISIREKLSKTCRALNLT